MRPTLAASLTDGKHIRSILNNQMNTRNLSVERKAVSLNLYDHAIEDMRRLHSAVNVARSGSNQNCHVASYWLSALSRRPNMSRYLLTADSRQLSSGQK
jgi:hypothetical protein